MLNYNEIDSFDDILHPIDFIEDMSRSYNWKCQRNNQDKASIAFKGQYQSYDMVFVWDEELETLQLSCMTNICFDNEAQNYIPTTLMSINANLWLGHFIFQKDDNGNGQLVFRHTMSLRNTSVQSGHDCLKSLIDTAIQECDRFYPLFNLVQTKDVTNPAKLNLALSDCHGIS